MRLSSHSPQPSRSNSKFRLSSATGRAKALSSSLFLVFLGIGFMIRAVELGLGSLGEPRSGLFPFLNGFILTVIASVLFLKDWRGEAW